MEEVHSPKQLSLNPTCTGTSVIAVVYDGGVAILTDRLVSYFKFARYHQITRQFQVNSRVVVAFGGDHSDFQWLKNVIQRQAEKLEVQDPSTQIGPQMLHGYLTTLMYNRRTKMKPLWNILVVAGMQKNNDEFEPYIGVVNQRGLAYPTKSLATGISAWILNQMIETEMRPLDWKMTREQVIAFLRKSMEITVYFDCQTDGEYDITTIDSNGVSCEKPEKVVGNWDISEYNCNYD